jgi:hypothetical protein
MRTIGFWVLLGVMGAGASPAVVANSKARAKEFWAQTYVKIQGRMAAADGSPLEATLTFSAPVRLPKLTLREGTYLFRMVTPSTLRISSVDGATVYATFDTTTVTRSKDLSQPLVRFVRTSAVLPPVLVAIFPENASVGYRLSTPKSRQRGQVPAATAGTR